MLQINLRHCKAATHQLTAKLAALQYGVALVQEPWVVNGRVRGFAGNDLVVYQPTCDRPRTCIVTTGNVTAQLAGGINDMDITGVFVDYRHGGTDKRALFISSYMAMTPGTHPPSQELEEAVRYGKHVHAPILIGCDSNAHHYLWGSRNVNRRGTTLSEYIVNENLDIMNQGDTDTFVTFNGSSVIDITLATPDMSNHVKRWRVLLEDSLSDHRSREKWGFWHSNFCAQPSRTPPDPPRILGVTHRLIRKLIRHLHWVVVDVAHSTPVCNSNFCGQPSQAPLRVLELTCRLIRKLEFLADI